MNVELFPFQKQAVAELQLKTSEAAHSYDKTHAPQVVSFTAPTGSGKTIIISSVIESILNGDDTHMEHPDAVFVWLSDSPQLNEQSRMKIETKADKIRASQCVSVSDDSFDQETFDDGHIYFLNTQKLSSSSNLTKHGDSRTHTIWETIANTVREKGNRLYFIIDEAHRGMQGRKASDATTVMQKFIKGSRNDHVPPMPVVIGMSATPERFETLVRGTTSTTHKVAVLADNVRASGLLKDRIVITYPDESGTGNDLAILQAAADDWRDKSIHWAQYCTEQHYAQVNPILVIQVQNGTHGNVTDTDLDECIAQIETRTGIKLHEGEVVHTFGNTSSPVTANGLVIRYEEPSRIAEDRSIRVVFFKENLSTGWDCPRAETMMSFRRGEDATYVAQLLGRMIRTPMQRRVQVDETLNDVHLFLPHFNKDTVAEVIKALQSAEGGEIPADVSGHKHGHTATQTLTVNTGMTKRQTDSVWRKQSASSTQAHHPAGTTGSSVDGGLNLDQIWSASNVQQAAGSTMVSEDESGAEAHAQDVNADGNEANAAPPIPNAIDRAAVAKYVNDIGLLSYDVQSTRISDYLRSLYKMAHFLTMSAVHKPAVCEVREYIVDKVHSYARKLRENGEYDALADKVKQLKLEAQIFDVFGEKLDTPVTVDMFTTDAGIERQFRLADKILGSEGIGNAYINKYYDGADFNPFKIDVILYAADVANVNDLRNRAKEWFHEWHDEFRGKVNKTAAEKLRQEYNRIVSEGDKVSKHCFRLPETIKVSHKQDDEGQEYPDHLFVDEDTGTAVIKLNGWESAVIDKERDRSDFVCWIRNPPRAPWALSIPYEINGETRSMYPDLLVIRSDSEAGYQIDILEPHGTNLKDNLAKAKGLAAYAGENTGAGRIELIRLVPGPLGSQKIVRLDMNKSKTRDKVRKMQTNDELDHLFDTDGVVDRQ